MKRLLTFLLLSAFSTIAFSQHPTNLIASNITSSSVDLSCDATACSGNIHYRYRVSSTTTWTQNLNINFNTHQLAGLTANTMYDWSVKCAGQPGWAATEIFTTTNCNITNAFTTSNASCSGSADGVINTNASNGASPYAYSWNNGSSTQNLAAIDSGLYIVTITDDLGCLLVDSVTLGFDNIKSISQTISTFIDTANSNYPGIVDGYHTWAYDTLSIINNGCDVNIRPEFIISHSNQAIQSNHLELRYFHPLFGAMLIPYNIDNNGNAYGFWNASAIDSTGFNLTMLSTNQMIMRVKFKNQAPLGLYTAIWNTKEVDAQGNILQALTPNDTTLLTLVICNNFSANESHSDITCFGQDDGSAIITINNGSGNYTYSWSNGLTSDSISNLLPGNYFCNIIDTDWGCADSVNFSITEPTAINASASSSNISCFGLTDGTASVQIQSPATYLWNTGEITAQITNLFAGTYICIVTDSNACTYDTTLTIIEPAQLSSSVTSTDASCFAGTDGGAVVNFSGGTVGSALGDTNYILGFSGTYVPLYFPNTIFNTTLLPPPYNSIPAGIYLYSVTDLNGCIIFDTITITQPDNLYAAYTITDYNGYNVSCNDYSDGAIDVQINGGTPPFTHYFDGSVISNNTITNLGAGTYTNSIIDNNNCVFTETITLTEPDAINIILASSSMSCFDYCDGSIPSIVTGGVVPYYYAWTNMIGDSLAGFQEIDSLCVGGYILDVVDANGCTERDTGAVIQPNAISYNIDAIFDASSYGSNDGLIHISPTGGSGTVTASWSGPNGFTSNNEDIDTLEAGSYYLVLEDTNSCIYLDTIEITQPPSIIIDTIGAISCSNSCDGFLNITVTGSNSAYTFLWTSPNGFTSTSEDITSLCAGYYIVQLYEGNIYLLADTFMLSQPQPLISIITADTITCYEGQTTAEIEVFGGNFPFQYNWSNGDTNYYTDLSAGTHVCTGTDNYGCIFGDSITLINPDSMSLQATAINGASCNGMGDGELTLIVTNGGTPPFLYSENGINYQIGNTLYNLAAGTANYFVIDDNGCSNTIASTTYEPAALVSVINVTDTISCYGGCDGGATLGNVTGGTNPYTYEWDDDLFAPQITATASNLCAGFYNVIITDANGCLATNSTIITEPDPIIINIWQNGNAIQATTGFINYQWYDGVGNAINGATNNTFTPIVQGEYSVEVTGINGCSAMSYSILVIIEIIDYINQHEIKLTIYPNPTKGKLTIESSEDLTSISVLNLAGDRLIFVDNNIPFEKKTNLDLSPFAKGIYFIQIELNNQLINHRIILQ